MLDVVLFGLGQNAEVVKAYFDWEGSYRVVAYTVHSKFIVDETKDDLPVVAWEGLQKSFPPEQVSLFCPISFREINQVRKDIFQEGLARGYDFISFIHPKAEYYGTPVGKNCLILENNVIQPHVSIGDNCILWSGNHIGHHSNIEDHVFVASHVVVSGGVDVGERCFLGVNATIRDNVKIGEASVIGAGALVTRDIAPHSVLPGNRSVESKLRSFELKEI